jgi:hypothetical protein
MSHPSPAKDFFSFFFAVLGLELRAFTTPPVLFFVKGFLR